MVALQEEEDIETLTDLGLTLLQAKTYLTLAKLGTANIKTAAKVADIARQNMYQVIPSLQKLGLVEKILTSPAIYKATPMEEGLGILLQHKTKQYAELRSKTKKLIDHCHTKSIISPQEEEAQFIVTSEAGLVTKRLENQIYSAKRSIDTVSTWQCCGFMLCHYKSEISKALKKGVKFRALTDKEQIDKLSPLELKNLKSNPLFQIRYSTIPIQIRMTIADQQDVNLCISTSANRGLPNMWSNNPNFAKLAIGWFEEMWKEAKQ